LKIAEKTAILISVVVAEKSVSVGLLFNCFLHSPW